jgi:hypothetical protein
MPRASAGLRLVEDLATLSRGARRGDTAVDEP